jgi:hypothetical protein
MSDHNVTDTMLEIAMVVDTAQHATAERRTDPSFLAASAVVRYYRRDRIEKTGDPVMVVRYVKELDADLADIPGGAADGAIAEARLLVREMLDRLTAGQPA